MKTRQEQLEEINKKHGNMMKRCKTLKCPYMRALGTGNYIYNRSNVYCAYLEITGHMRGCPADTCEHYKDEVNKDERNEITF